MVVETVPFVFEEIVAKNGHFELFGKFHRPSRTSFHLGVVVFEKPKGVHGVGVEGNVKVSC